MTNKYSTDETIAKWLHNAQVALEEMHPERYDYSVPQAIVALCTEVQEYRKAGAREKIRADHAEWSGSTFGNVGPVGPLKHLSKEALEAAAAPGDLTEWADMQFLLWDAQRRAGITDEQLTQAMNKKLAVNKARKWPEPKDGEPRYHVATPQPVPAVKTKPTELAELLAAFDEILRITDRKHVAWDRARAAIAGIKNRGCNAEMGGDYPLFVVDPNPEGISRAVLKRHQFRDCVDLLHEAAIAYAGCQQLRSRLVSALLSYVEPEHAVSKFGEKSDDT